MWITRLQPKPLLRIEKVLPHLINPTQTGYVKGRFIGEGIRLTNRFHVAVRLFSNRSQMTSKCGKNKKVVHEAIAECVTDVLTTF